MNSLGWSRREQPVSTSTSKPSGVYGTLQKLNPFSSEGYVRLPVHENEEGPGAPLPARSRREEEEGFFARKSDTAILAFDFDTPTTLLVSEQCLRHQYLRRGMSASAGSSCAPVRSAASHQALHYILAHQLAVTKAEFLRPAARCTGLHVSSSLFVMVSHLLPRQS
jgi:hypothetical protein